MTDKEKAARIERVIKIVMDEDHYFARARCDEAFKQVFYEVSCAERSLRKATESLLSTAEEEIAHLDRQLKGAEELLVDARVERDIATKSAKRLICLLRSVIHRLPGDVIEEMVQVAEAMKKAESK